MSKLSEKFAAGKAAVAQRTAEGAAGPTASGLGPQSRVTGPQHGSVVTMKMEMLKQEIQTLKEGKPAVKLDPKTIRASAWANRMEDAFLSSEFAHFKAEISSAGGNTQAIKVRPVVGSTEPAYELVYGHRRHRACLELGLPVTAVIDELDDKSLFIEMERENRGRKDLSPYEQGVMYARALDEGLFPSIRRMAEEIGEDHSNVAKAIKLARLPDHVLDSFQSRLDVQHRWATALQAAIEKEPDLILARAQDIKKQQAGGNHISSARAYSILIGGTVSKPVPRTVPIGKHKLLITESKDAVSYELPVLSREKQERIEDFIAKVMAE